MNDDVLSKANEPRSLGGCAVFVMLTREEQEADTYGELGWRVYEGCEACCADFASVMLCGGMYTHLHTFVGDRLRDSSGAAEIPPAAAPIEDGDPTQ